MYLAKITIERIQKRIKELGFTQKKVFAECNINEDTMKKMTDNKGMSSFSLARIADYLDCSVDYLLGRDEVIRPHSESEWDVILSQMSDESLLLFRDYAKFLLWKQAQADEDKP